MAPVLTELEDSARAARIRCVEEGQEFTLAELLAQSRAVAHDLRAGGVGRGDLVGLVLRNGSGFLRTLFAVWYCDAVAVPLALPFALGGLDRYLEQTRRIVLEAGMGHLVVGRDLRAVRGRLAAALPSTRLLEAVEPPFAAAPDVTWPGSDRSGPALVQYTSGSTSDPKGVVLTHANIEAGLHAIRDASGMNPAEVAGCWLPLFHDMGLFSTLGALTAGGRVVLWQPNSFVRRPLTWLAEFARYGCTLCAAPNFCYDLLADCAGEPEPGLDLSAWRIAYNGAEPVLASTIGKFTARFARHGFRPETMLPVYGMAEATLGVTFADLDRPPVTRWVDRTRLGTGARVVPAEPGPGRARALTGLGRPVPGMAIRVVADGVPAPEGVVGEIEISGPSVTGGYLHRPPGDERAPDGWLRTGDLGFVLDGDLHLVGRRKNLVIIRGTNYHAEDAEAAVRLLSGIYHQRCVAVPAKGEHGEVLALVAETQLTDPDHRVALAQDIHRELVTRLGLTEIAVHLAPPRGIPMTSSGKIQRHRVPDAFAAGRFQPVQGR